jgi:hypothetical protein
MHTFITNFILSNQIVIGVEAEDASPLTFFKSEHGRTNAEKLLAGEDPVVPRRNLAPGQLRHLYPR